MEENNSTELEEGEACCYREEEGSSSNFDPDIALSYIDGKIQNILGHFQRNFEGLLSAETLGPAFGDYGSFLPTYERSPLSRQKSPERSNVSTKSRNNIPSAGLMSRILQAPATALPSSRLKNAQSNADNLHDKKFPSGNLSVKQVKQEPSSSSDPVAENPTKGGALIMSGNRTNLRTLKVRIKMGSDKIAKVNAALYSGLGLEGSPSTSLGSSSQESGGFPSLSAGATDESPGSILQAMTSFPVACSELISPLHESLISLVKEGVFAKDNKPADNIKVSPGQNTEPVDQLVPKQGDAVLSKVKKIKSETRKEKAVEMNKGNAVIVDNKTSFPGKKKINNEMLDGEASLRYNLEKASLSNTGDAGGEPRKMAAKASEVFQEANRVKVTRKLKSESLRESPLKPISGPDYGLEMEKRQRSPVVKSGEHGVSSSQGANGQFAPTENGKWKEDKVSVLPKDRQHVAKNEEDFVAGEVDSLKWKAGHEAPCHEHSDTGVPFRDEKQLIGGQKRSTGSGLEDKIVLSGKDRLRIVAGLPGKDKKGPSHDIPPTKKKGLKLTSRKHINKLGKQVDALESFNGEQKHVGAPSAGRRKDASSTYLGVDNDDVINNPREIKTNGVTNSSFSRAPAKGAVGVIPGAPIAEMVPAAPSLLDNWVCCDLCEKWRLLPNGRKPEDLPKRWMCSMLDWLPRMNSCDIHEDVTTGMMRSLILYPGVGSQDQANGSALGVTSNVQNLGQNPQNVSTIETDGGGTSKLGPKEMLKKLKAEPVKRRSLNNMNQSPAELNSLRRCNLSESKSQDLALGENMLKQKEKNLNRGDMKLIKEKSKRKSDQFDLETTKRAKREEINNGAKHGNADTEVCRTGLSSGKPKLTLVKGKGHFDECSSPEEVNHGHGGRLIVSVKNLSNQAQFSTDSPSVNLKNVVKGSSSLKKRKLKGSQDDQIDGGPYHHSAEDSKLITKEETGEYMIKKENKSRVQEAVIRDSSSKDGNSRSGKDGKAIREFSSGIRNHFTDDVEEDRHPSKSRKKLAPKQATSSSSKVSGSQKSRVNYEVQSSPVESVSSSPLRVTRPDNLTQRNAVNRILPVVDNVSKGSHDKVSGGNKLSGAVMDKGLLQREARPSSGFENGNILDGTTDYLQHGNFPVSHTSHDNGVYAEQSGNALRQRKKGDLSSLASNGKGRSSASDSDRDKVKALETAGKEEAEHLKKGQGHESLAKAPPFGQVRSQVHPDPAQKNEKNHTRRDLSKQNKHVESHGRTGNHYSDFGLESPSENTCSDSNRRMGAAPVSVESRSGKEKLLSHLEEEGKQGTPSRGSQLVGPRITCNGLPVDAASNGELLKRNKRNGVSNCLERLTSEMHDAKDTLSSSPSRANQSVQTAFTVLKEAEKLRDFADRLKGTKFGFEGNESCFTAALKFLEGASLLETGNVESSKQREMTPMQVYSTAAKLCESCATEFERCQELASAALAYKCMEVAYMRVVYCKYASLNRDRHELQATLHQGESPSSSASDIDNLNNQAVADRSNLSKGAGSHAVGNHIVVARNRPSFVRLLDFTHDVHLAMEASRKSQDVCTAASATMEESQNKEHIITSLRKVIDFSFQDIDGLLRLMQLAREAISRPGFSNAKE
ncbi:hypothetical protein CRG98_033126 [Punica granatum]|uniref:CW-type domain-containing protein n=1 Tax=Punica granatum TaxID=22663 RepID=A0A2I0IRX1_PUNGR|nr:hypothetical protein CRG98_033126 [Punica granatum]